MIENKWIKFEEKLPQDGLNVLICSKTKSVRVIYFKKNDSIVKDSYEQQYGLTKLGYIYYPSIGCTIYQDDDSSDPLYKEEITNGNGKFKNLCWVNCSYLKVKACN